MTLQIERVTRPDPLTGEIEQQCHVCCDWWPLTVQFFERQGKGFAATCRVCRKESIGRARRLPRIKQPAVARGFQPAEDWQRTRRGVNMTATMFTVLGVLVEGLRQDWHWLPLPDVHKRTLNALSARGWIVDNPGLDGLRWRITPAGQRAHSLFAKPHKRLDGICPSCGIRPKYVRPSGYRGGWCKECEAAYKRFRYAKRMDRINPDRLCSACHQRPLHRMSGGGLSTYCTECRHARRKAEKRAQHDRDLARIRAGEVLLCRECKREPRAYTERYVRDRCHECQRAYMAKYNDRRRPSSAAAQNRQEQP